MKKIILTFLSFILFIIGFFAYWKFSESYRIDTTFYQFHSSKVEKKFRVVQLSDLHMKEFGKNNEKLIKKVQKLNPDIIAITGDMNNGNDLNYDTVLKLCEELKKVAPIYYCLGNHEYKQVLNQTSNIKNDIKNLGITLLDDEQTDIIVKGNHITICGMSQGAPQYDRFGTHIIQKFEQSDNFKLLLTHYPELFFDKLVKNDIDLSLTGHAHGGQVQIPLVGGLYSPSQGWFPKLTKGMSKHGKVTVVVSRGLGNTNKLPRINNNPEIDVIDISK